MDWVYNEDMMDGEGVTIDPEKAVDKPTLPEVLFGDLGKREFGINDEGKDEILGRWLLKKRQDICEKYNLPDRNLRQSSTGEYIRQLYLIANRNGTQIVEGGIGEERVVGDVMFDENTNSIRVPEISKETDQKSWIAFGSDLAHELVHALQEKMTPEMPIEEMELEACLGVNMEPDLLNEKWIQGVLVYEVAVSSSYYRRDKGLEVPWR